MSKLIDGLKSISDFLNDALGAVGDSGVVDAVKSASQLSKQVLDSSLVQAAGQAASDTLPVIAFALKYAEILTRENDPEKQGYAACTMAYNRSVEQVIRAAGRDLVGLKRTAGSLELLSSKGDDDAVDMQSFVLDGSALSHGFVQRANGVFREFLGQIRVADEKVTNRLVNGVQYRFLTNLRVLMTHPDTESLFAAFTAMSQFDREDYRARRALEEHLRYQVWSFNEAPVFGQEPFALNDVYVDMDCGVLRWGQIQGPERGRGRFAGEEESKQKNPYSEVDSERQSLMEVVLDLIADPQMNEPIVIQGVAGAGKSSFTRKLVHELYESGLYPVRVLLKHLDLKQDIRDAFPGAIEFGGERFWQNQYRPEFDGKWFAERLNLNEETHFRGQKLSPYVFIFDGWDEISTGSSAGFKDRIHEVLQDIRRYFIDQRRGRPKMRVIVTGRPTVDVTKPGFLRKDTPVLTVRSLNHKQLGQYLKQLVRAYQSKPVTVEGEVLDIGDRDESWFEGALKNYSEGFQAMLQAHREHRGEDTPSGKLAVLGMPLLANLAVRLMLECQSQEQMQALLDVPTTLYRALVDMTYQKGAKPESADIEGEDRYRIVGRDLRVLLWRTAAAMTATGNESISREELRLRIDWEEEELQQVIKETTEDNVLSGLIISYFFKEGSPEQGCEFLHKSFREYLFAEGIVELLKEYGRDERVGETCERDSEKGLRERKVYWKDFDKDDPRYDFSHRLSKVLATQWLTPEVKNHLEQLLEWEIQRSCGTEVISLPGKATDALSRSEWEFVRDGLADLWSWWADGVMSRPQPVFAKRRGDKKFDPPFAVELVEWCSPEDPAEWKTGASFEVESIASVDGRIGDAFFHLTVVVHAALLRINITNVESHQKAITNTISKRRYQWSNTDRTELIYFSPSGKSPNDFKNFCARINASGWRPQGQFPSYSAIHYTNLCQVDLDGASLDGANLDGANLDRASLARANLDGAILDGAILDGAGLNGANLYGANLYGARYDSHTSFPEHFNPDDRGMMKDDG